MSMFTAVPSRMRPALFALLVTAAPSLGLAQAGNGRSATVVVTVPSVRVRTAPSPSSLSIDEFREGSVFAVADDDYQTKDWTAILLDGRVAFVPRLAVATRSRQPAAAPAPEPQMVMQAGAPAAALPPVSAPAPTFAPAFAAAPRSAPATQPAPVERVAVNGPARTAPAVTPAPAPAAAAPVAAAPVAAPVAAAPVVLAAAAPVAAAAVATAAPTAAVPAAPAPAERKADQPQFSARRAGVDVTVGLLGSVTPIKTNGLTPTAHIAGVTFLGAGYRSIGIYFAPEYGQGGGYRSTMMGGGLSISLLSLNMLHVTALGGYMKYSQVAMPDSTILVPQSDRSLQGPSVGGMASIPFIGPMRLAYRGQYVMARDAGVQVKMIRHSVGLVF
jgi:hypothetical protein